MTKNIFLLLILIISCQKPPQEEEKSIYGVWQHIETKSGQGHNSPPTKSKVENGRIMQFNQNGTYKINHNGFCYSDTMDFGTFIIDTLDPKYNLLKIQLDCTDKIPEIDYELIYILNFKNQNLVLGSHHGTTSCLHGCTYTYKRIE